MNFHADPGNIFDSDVHRRVAAHLPADGEPIDMVLLHRRLLLDLSTPLARPGKNDISAIEEVLRELEAGGDVDRAEEGWSLTEAGLAKLTGPALVPQVVDGELTLAEPPPLEGEELAAAEKQTARIEREAEEDTERERGERIERLKAELAEAESEGS